jgi:hypothetical protein
MANIRLSNKQAKKILLKTWPRTIGSVWPTKNKSNIWIRAHPVDGKTTAPIISLPGTDQHKTRPDGLWVNFNDIDSCDAIAIEVCSSIQNLHDKRSRYMPMVSALVLRIKKTWLNESVSVKRGAKKRRQIVGGVRAWKNHDEVSIPIRYLGVLYCLPNNLYEDWSATQIPAGHEYFCRSTSLSGITSQHMRSFLRQMTPLSRFMTKYK